MLEQQALHRGGDLAQGFFGDVSKDERLVVAIRVRLSERPKDRCGGIGGLLIAELWIDGTEHGVRIHDDLVGGDRDERAARHGVVGHKDGHLALVTLECERDLLRGKDEAAGGVHQKIDRHLRRGEPNGAQDLLGIFYVDVASDRKTEEAHGLLAMDHRDQPGLAPLLEAMECPVSAELEHLLLVEGNEELSEDEEPEEPREVDHRAEASPFPGSNLWLSLMSARLSYRSARGDPACCDL